MRRLPTLATSLTLALCVVCVISCASASDSATVKSYAVVYSQDDAVSKIAAALDATYAGHVDSVELEFHLVVDMHWNSGKIARVLGNCTMDTLLDVCTSGNSFAKKLTVTFVGVVNDLNAGTSHAERLRSRRLLLGDDKDRKMIPFLPRNVTLEVSSLTLDMTSTPHQLVQMLGLLSATMSSVSTNSIPTGLTIFNDATFLVAEANTTSGTNTTNGGDQVRALSSVLVAYSEAPPEGKKRTEAHPHARDDRSLPGFRKLGSLEDVPKEESRRRPYYFKAADFYAAGNGRDKDKERGKDERKRNIEMILFSLFGLLLVACLALALLVTRKRRMGKGKDVDKGGVVDLVLGFRMPSVPVVSEKVARGVLECRPKDHDFMSGSSCSAHGHSTHGLRVRPREDSCNVAYGLTRHAGVAVESGCVVVEFEEECAEYEMLLKSFMESLIDEPKRSQPSASEDAESASTSRMGSVDDRTTVSWTFDAFVFAQNYEWPLAVAAMYAIKRRGLIEALNLDCLKLARFLATIETIYNTNNAYHNNVHAADVVQTALVMLCAVETGTFEPHEELALLLAAVIHDCVHTGESNKDLALQGHALARVYNNRSVVEKYSSAIGHELMTQPELEFMSEELRRLIEPLTTALILVTDIVEDRETMPRAEKLVQLKQQDNSSLEAELVRNSAEVKLTLLSLVMKAADVGHLLEKMDVHRRWVRCLHDEMFAKELIAEGEARAKETWDSFCEGQIGFFDAYAMPLFRTMKSLLGEGLTPAVTLGQENRDYWAGKYGGQQKDAT